MCVLAARAMRDVHRRGSVAKGGGGSAKDLKLSSPGGGGRTGFDVDVNK